MFFEVNNFCGATINQRIGIESVEDFSKYCLSRPRVNVNFTKGNNDRDNFLNDHGNIHVDYFYAMSYLDRNSKFSESYVNCIGTIVSEFDNEEELPLSFLIHQYPHMKVYTFGEFQFLRNEKFKWIVLRLIWWGKFI